MRDQARQRYTSLQLTMRDQGAPMAVLSDESSIAYYAGFWGYLGIEFGRPTFLIARADSAPIILTPLMESEMVAAMTWVEDIRTWQDSGENSWQNVLMGILGKSPDSIWLETLLLPAIARQFFDDRYDGHTLNSISPIISAQRMIKSAEEIGIMRKAGEIAAAMMGAAQGSLAEGVPEYESALAVIDAGSRKAAGFLTDQGWEAFISPMIHNLQIMQSGTDSSMVHRRASVKTYQRGDPVYFCFCNMAQFKLYKLGFDRMFFIGELSDQQARVQEVANAAQQAAIDSIRPGIEAQAVAAAANEIYRSAGFETGYRTGRSIGMSYLEAPELKTGDKTILQAGMTFAVDGGISVDGECGGRIGDSIVVTETGCDYLTNYARGILVV